MELTEKQKQRFFDRANRKGDCWNWTATVDSLGYGVLSIKSGVERCHRIAWFLENGPIPAGMYVCHKCDNRLCCNPSHLFVGTDQDNKMDMIFKGRTAQRDDHWNTKIPESELNNLRAMRVSGMTQKLIASKYGVGQDQISRILSGHRRGIKAHERER